MNLNNPAPISQTVRARLLAGAGNIRAAAQRKGTTLDSFEERRESNAAREHFELGCWLHYYAPLVGRGDGLQARIDCAARLFLSGITNPGDDFFTVFDFGDRQFDTIFEMGDSEMVIDGLRQMIQKDKTGRIAEAFSYFGWPVKSAPVPSVPKPR